jgi:hypothetical protein
VDIGSISINCAYLILLLIYISKGETSQVNKDRLNLLAAFAVFTMWIKVFYWMKLFAPTAYFLAQLTETV